MQYCPHCMKPVTGGGNCPNCGGDLSWTGQKGIDLPVGTVLGGGNGLRTYQIGAARGKGGFGITYIALETNSGRRMAVKEYFPTRCAFRSGNGVVVQAMTGQEEAFRSGMNSFLEEGKMLLSQDDLPCVVHVIDYFQVNGTAYLVMEYLDGVALHAQMARMGGRIPVGELMPRLALLMRDIGQLHRRGVIHRDISPDNIMWMPDGGLKLLDFGSARSMESGKSMTVLMKQGFSPIEQYRSKGQGPYTDIYALAATIYYCVTGVIPPSSMERMGEDTLQSPIALGAALSVQQETALLWALSIQPEARPQNMEEFAAMLYKEGPAPAPAGFRPQPVQPPQVPPQPPQVPPQPAAGQNAGYPYGQNYAGRSAGPGQISGQTPPQPVTERNTVYPYGQGYTGQGYAGQGYAGQGAGPGQPIGQYAGQSAGQGQNPSGGGKNKLPVFIGIGAGAAAVIVAAIIGVFVWLGRDGGNTVEHSEKPSQSAAPGASFEPTLPAEITPTPEPTPSTVTGVTDDGFLYEIIDQNHAVLTGYEGARAVRELPDYIENVPVSAIADNAFAGVSIDECILLPQGLETIGASAFRGCSNLVYVVAYSDVTAEPTSFSGCDNLWFVAAFSSDASSWNLPSGVSWVYFGMETGIGLLEDAGVSDGLLVGMTEDGDIVLLDVQPGVTYLDLDDVDWICTWALDHVDFGATINVGEYTLFPYEIYDSRDYWIAPGGSQADMWLLTCKTAFAINEARPSGAPMIEPDIDLVGAAYVRAEELTRLYDSSQRPSGEKWSTVFDEQGIDWMYAGGNSGYQDSLENLHTNVQKIVSDSRTSPLTQEQSADLAGQYFNLIGVGYCLSSDGRYYYQSFVIIS